MNTLRIFGPFPDNKTTCMASATETLCKSLLFIIGASIPFLYATHLSGYAYETQHAAITMLLMSFTFLMVQALKTGILQQLSKKYAKQSDLEGITPAVKGKIGAYISVMFLLAILMLINKNNGETMEMYYFSAVTVCLNLSLSFLAVSASLNQSIRHNVKGKAGRAMCPINNKYAYQVSRTSLETKIFNLKVCAVLSALPALILKII